MGDSYFCSKNTLYFPLTKRMSRSFERRWAKEAARTFLEWVLLGSMFMLHTVECFNFSGGWQFKHKAGLNLGTLYNKLLRIARNLLETRENIKIESRSFYHIICDWFSWGSSQRFEKRNRTCPYVGQPHHHIGGATSMPFASINSNNQRTNP